MFYTLAYTFARSDDTPMEPIAMVFGGMNDRRSLAIQGRMLDTRAPGNNDQHQHLTASAMCDTTMFRRRSPRAFEEVARRLGAQGGLYVAEPGCRTARLSTATSTATATRSTTLAPDTTRNQHRLPYRGSADPRVARRFRLGGSRQLAVIWEAFNLTNRPNYTATDNTRMPLNGSSLVGSPFFGRRTAQADGRVMQLAARLTF